MPSSKAKPDAPIDPNKLKREAAGRYTTADGRFTVEQGSNGWMVIDSQETNELGLPLVQGPFDTLDAARDGVAAAREGAAPVSGLAERIEELKRRPPARPDEDESGRARRARRPRTDATRRAAKGDADGEARPSVDIRPFKRADADALRALWFDAGLASSEDDDASLRRFAERNPGLLLVATAERTVVGSALGAWDGRRGWIYHVAVAPDHRRSGLGTRLVREVESKLRELGGTKVNAIVRDDNPSAVLFWEAAGYGRSPTRLFRRELDGD
jgi:ribosomal protein S18 acetylase RimI-like enzyme